MTLLSTIDWAVEELRCLASYKATGGEWDERRCRRILEATIDKVYPWRDKQAVAMTRTCLWYLKEQRRAIRDAHGKDSVPAYLNRCIDKLSCFETAAPRKPRKAPVRKEGLYAPSLRGKRLTYRERIGTLREMKGDREREAADRKKTT